VFTAWYGLSPYITQTGLVFKRLMEWVKHYCKKRLLQRHPEAVWTCKSVCTITRDLCRKL